MMLTAYWHMLTMTKTHTNTNTKTKTKKRENFQRVREGIVTLCCNISIKISYMRFFAKTKTKTKTQTKTKTR